MRMLANIFMCVGCFIFVKSNPGTVDSITGTDRGPSQVWPLSFAILAFYLCTLFELRVFKPLGVVVNIILNITRRSMWYFLTFFLFLVGFTHALLHMLHSRKYVFCGNNCTDGEYQDDYPVDFFAALSATYFFLAGRYDPVSNSLDKGTANIHIMMVVFYTFSGVLFMNIIIAVMNDAFDESKRQSHIAWTTQLSKVIANLEYIFIRKGWRNSDFFPDYIYYVVSEKEPGFGAEAASGKQNSAQVTQEELAEIRSLRQNVTQVIQEELAGVRRCLQQNANQVVQEELTETLRSLRQMQEDFARSIQAQKPAAAATSLAQELPSLSSDSQPELDPCSRIPTAQPSGRETEGFTIAPEKASMDANSSEPPGHEIARASTRLQKNNASNPVDVDENGGDGNDGTSDQAQIAPPQRAHTDDREP
ncbi:hypothetical protein EDD21DRAFT_363028 [Dissophora ornata]|nr:hypothetical protein EDD21DRAFT_363028 [Dissophora ornata]